MLIIAFFANFVRRKPLFVMDIKAALFDLDGVIINTEPLYTEFWRAIGREYFPGDADFANKLKGKTFNDILSRYFKNEDKARRDIRRKLDNFESEMDFPLIDGVETFLNQLKEKGVPMAVVTSSDRFKMESLKRKRPTLLECFDRLFTAEDSLKSKPAPDCYISAAKALCVQPSYCCIFEDSINGLKAARDSGAFVVGLTTSFPKDVVEVMSDMVIPDFSNLKISDIK